MAPGIGPGGTTLGAGHHRFEDEASVTADATNVVQIEEITKDYRSPALTSPGETEAGYRSRGRLSLRAAFQAGTDCYRQRLHTDSGRLRGQN